ncbi:MAG: translation elongation factor Ts [Anaerolineae bacterium]
MQITAQMVKELREATGAAFLDCKKALEEHDGDIARATEYLRQKGLATAAKKSERVASDGLVETYTHPGGRVGVMVEVNCETDFVARTEQFAAFAHDLALHIAFHAPAYLKVEDIPQAKVEAKQAEFRRDAVAEGKPENVADRIAEGRLNKWYEDVALLIQPWIRDDSGKRTVQDVLTELVAELKENIVIRRFARYEIGEPEEA